MVSKEPNHLLTGQTKGKSALADKLPGTMTVRSVLLNRDSPDIESRLKRRRNRTHQVRFKDLEDGSSSSGNSGTGESNSHQRPAADCDSPHPLRKHGGRPPRPWADGDGPQPEALPGQTSVVGAVRGDMASTIEVVAAFLARAPPHPLTPGPSRRCWAPPQTNSLTLPMTRRSGSSTSTAIQTSPRLKKPLPLSHTHTRSHSLGDSVGVDGDDEHDSQDEYLQHNHVSRPSSKEQNGPPGPGGRSAVERRSKVTRTEIKSAVGLLKSSRHSCPPSVLHGTESCPCPPPCRAGSSTPSAVRRRKRLNRTSSDPGREVHYCTTPTQTESRSPSPPTPSTTLCTTQVQTERPSPPLSSNCCTTQSQTESHPPLQLSTRQRRTTQTESVTSPPALPPTTEQCTTHLQTDPPGLSAPGSAPTQTPGPGVSPPPIASSSSDNLAPPPAAPDPQSPLTTTVPYCPSPPAVQTPQHCTEAPRSPPAEPTCSAPPPPRALPVPSSTSASAVIHPPIPYYTVVSPPSTPSAAVVCPTPAPAAPLCPTQSCASPVPSLVSPPTLTSTPPTPSVTPVVSPFEPLKHLIPAAAVRPGPQSAGSSAVPPPDSASCTLVSQTALSCTSISYYTTTHPLIPVAPHLNPTVPTYATVIQTVSHCSIPCQALQNTSSASSGIAPYSSSVPKIKSCTSPPLLVKTFMSNLPHSQPNATPTKAVPLYSSTFRAAPPYTPPSQAPHSAQDKRGIRLPPPPPPPPPYTPRKKGNDPPGPGTQTPVLRAAGKAGGKDRQSEKEREEDVKCADSPKPSERARSLQLTAPPPPATSTQGPKQPCASSAAGACLKAGCLSSAQARLGALHRMLCSGAGAPPGQQGCSSSERPPAGPLTAAQADTLRQLQEILGGLVSGARCKLDPARVTEKLLSPNGPLRDIRSLQTQLHSLEDVLETSQNTIKVLLDVIQDLEKKEAERDGRHSYRTGQDIENCGTCRDCACIIYSVEHDFRLQEGQVVRTWKVGDPPEGLPQPPTPQASSQPPSQQDSPQAVRPPASTKKNRKKCFWFL